MSIRMPLCTRWHAARRDRGARTAIGVLAFALVAAGLPAGCARPFAADSVAGVDEIRAQTRALFAAQTRGDVDATVAAFADDAVLMLAGSPAATGVAEIRAVYTRALGFLRAAEPEPLTTRAAASGELAYDAGRLTTVFGGPAGEQRFAGRYLAVWRRTTDGWRIAALTIVSEPAP